MATAHDSMTEAEHIEREKAYLLDIAAELAKGPEPVETSLSAGDHSNIPTLDFPAWETTVDGFGVWANWEGEGEHAHVFTVVPHQAEVFPLLPDGYEPGDAAAAAAIIREHIATLTAPTAE